MDIEDQKKKKGISLSTAMGTFVAGPAMLVIGITAAAVTAPTGIGVLAGVLLAGAGIATSALGARKLINDSRRNGEQQFRLYEGNTKKELKQQEETKSVSLAPEKSITHVPAGVTHIVERGAKAVAAIAEKAKDKTQGALVTTQATVGNIKAKVKNSTPAVTR